MSNDKLPVPNDPPNKSGYFLYKDESGNNPLDHSHAPLKWSITVEKNADKPVMFAESFVLSTVLRTGDEGANQIITAAQTHPIIIYEGTQEACETKMGQISEGFSDMKKKNHNINGIKIRVIHLA